MQYNLVHPLNYNQNEAQNMLLHNVGALPAGAVEGQVAYQSVIKKPYFYNGTSWQPFEGIDSYVTSATFNTVDGVLALGRNNGLGNITVDLDGRYLTENQNISLTGHITGSGTSAITTSLHPSAVTSQPDITVTDNYPTGTTYFLTTQDGVLKKYSSATLQDYINGAISSSGYVDAYTVTTNTVIGGASVTHFLGTTATDYTQTYSILGTSGEVEVTNVGNDIQIGLPSDVNIGNNLVVGGNLIVQGTTTTINSEIVNIADSIITLNSDYTGSTPTENAGIEVERGTVINTSLLWNESTDRWTFTNDGTTFYNIPLPNEYTNYYPSTQPVLNLGTGTKFVKTLVTNSLGQVTGGTDAELPVGSTSTVGIVELADNAEHLTGTSTSLAATPGGVAAMIAQSTTNNKFVTTITPVSGSTTNILHNLNTEDIHVTILNTATKEFILAPWKVVDANNIQVGVGNNPIGSLTVKIFK